MTKKLLSHKKEKAAYDKKYRQEHKEELHNSQKKCRQKHPEEYSARRKKYRQEHIKKESARDKKYYQENTKKILLRSKKYHQEHREECLARGKKYDQEHPEKKKAYLKKYEQEHPGEKQSYLKKYRQTPEHKKEKNKQQRERRKTDPKFHLNGRMSTSICEALKGLKGGRHWEFLVGYTLADLKNHLEKQFDEKMNWGNQGSYWHIDHIKPKSLFDFTTAEDPQFLECWGLKNLQPLEAMANLRKSNHY